MKKKKGGVVVVGYVFIFSIVQLPFHDVFAALGHSSSKPTHETLGHSSKPTHEPYFV